VSNLGSSSAVSLFVWPWVSSVCMTIAAQLLIAATPTLVR
jgi:hypothetical protein